MVSKRACFNCQTEMPQETEHYVLADEVYCINCVDAQPYTAYQFYLDGEYMGSSDDDNDSRHVESYEDEYEEGEQTNE